MSMWVLFPMKEIFQSAMELIVTIVVEGRISLNNILAENKIGDKYESKIHKIS